MGRRENQDRLAWLLATPEWHGSEVTEVKRDMPHREVQPFPRRKGAKVRRYVGGSGLVFAYSVRLVSCWKIAHPSGAVAYIKFT